MNMLRIIAVVFLGLMFLVFVCKQFARSEELICGKPSRIISALKRDGFRLAIRARGSDRLIIHEMWLNGREWILISHLRRHKRTCFIESGSNFRRY